MAARLRAILSQSQRNAARIDEKNLSNPWQANHPESIPALKEAMAQATSLGAHMKYGFHLVQELIWCGRNAEAITTLDDIELLARKTADQAQPDTVERIHETAQNMRAISYLRTAELENCVCGTTADSCIFPIQGGGVHRRPEGSRNAIAVLVERLKEKPNDLGAIWLLNLAVQTLGETPPEVRPEWIIPKSVFESERDIGRFRDVARERGVDRLGLAGGCSLADFDGDDLLDIIVSGFSLDEQTRFYHNLGGGKFEDRTIAAGLEGETGGLNISHADYDNDGRVDLLIVRGGWLGESGAEQCDSLLRNLGGTFDDVTEAAGLLTFQPGQVGIWADFDNDGWLDLFLGHEEVPNTQHPSLLFHNERNGKFRECAQACGLTGLGFVKGAAWGDYDNDGLPDLYVSIMASPNRLYHNEGRATSAAGQSEGFAWKFREVGAEAGVVEPRFSFSTWFFDYDNDGWLDLFVAGYKVVPVAEVAALYLGRPSAGELPRLYRNNRNGTFTDVTREAKLDRVLLPMGTNFGDIDNDGFLDMYLGTGSPDLSVLMPNRMFRNAEGRVFEDVTTSGGFGHLQKGHGVAIGDIDGDGDQDVYAVLGGWYSTDAFRNSLFENPGNGNHWVTMRLHGTRTNRSGMGARIKVSHTDGTTHRDSCAVVGQGSSFGSANLAPTIGLGASTRIESIEIFWPVSGTRQVLKDVSVDRTIEVTEE